MKQDPPPSHIGSPQRTVRQQQQQQQQLLFNSEAVKLHLLPRYVPNLQSERCLARNKSLGYAMNSFPLLVLVYLVKKDQN